MIDDPALDQNEVHIMAVGALPLVSAVEWESRCRCSGFAHTCNSNVQWRVVDRGASEINLVAASILEEGAKWAQGECCRIIFAGASW